MTSKSYRFNMAVDRTMLDAVRSARRIRTDASLMRTLLEEEAARLGIRRGGEEKPVVQVPDLDLHTEPVDTGAGKGEDPSDS